MATEVDVKYVVVSKTRADASEYVRAVVHPNEESARDYLAEVETSAPWQAHAVVPLDEFESAKTDETEKGDEF